jgi:hypothetical protein
VFLCSPKGGSTQGHEPESVPQARREHTSTGTSPYVNNSLNVFAFQTNNFWSNLAFPETIELLPNLKRCYNSLYSLFQPLITTS